MKRSLVFSLVLLAGAIVRTQTPTGPVVSPEVLADHRVTFRLRAPNAKEVSVEIVGGGKPLAMQRGGEGIWSATSEPLAPDYYGYSFVVDGVTMFDPSNSAAIPNFLYRASEVHVPPASGNSSDNALLPWELADVPHGDIHHHFYRS